MSSVSAQYLKFVSRCSCISGLPPVRFVAMFQRSPFFIWYYLSGPGRDVTPVMDLLKSVNGPSSSSAPNYSHSSFVEEFEEIFYDVIC